jgi:hypothetical protein
LIVRVRRLCDMAKKKTKLSSEGGNCGSKKCKRGSGGVYGGVWGSLRLAGDHTARRSICVGASGRNLASVAVKTFSHLICFINKFHTCCTFDAMCQHKSWNTSYYCSTQESFIPVNFDASNVMRNKRMEPESPINRTDRFKLEDKANLNPVSQGPHHILNASRRKLKDKKIR